MLSFDLAQSRCAIARLNAFFRTIEKNLEENKKQKAYGGRSRKGRLPGTQKIRLLADAGGFPQTPPPASRGLHQAACGSTAKPDLHVAPACRPEDGGGS